MNYENIVSHTDEHHQPNSVDLHEKFGGVEDVKEVLLKGVDFNGSDIIYNGSENLRVEFSKKADENTIKDIIIAFCMGAKSTGDTSDVEKEAEEFRLSFNSVSLATLNKNGEVVRSYAPSASTQWGNFTYTSEASKHFENTKINLDNIETMLLEDESKAASVILRKRLRYRTKASSIERGEEFDRVYDEFERQTGGKGGIKVIRKVLDFYLVELEFGKGRFVKGFDTAYNMENGTIK